MKSDCISAFLTERIAAGDFPSAVYLVAEKGEIVFQDALGFALDTFRKIPAQLDTIYDLASLTKPLVTGLLCAKLIENREINLADKIGKFFPSFGYGDKREITIQDLLTHTSGFAAWQPFYLTAENFGSSPADLTAFIAASELLNQPRTKVVYSDFNFILLGFLLEKLHDKTLYAISRAEILDKLNLIETVFNPHTYWQKQIAASEFGNEYEKQVCREMEFDVEAIEWRENLIWGEVHDGNCWFLSGVSGHAGLFSTAEEVFKIALQFLPNFTTLLKPETCALFETNFTPDLNEARSSAFQLAATEDSTASEALAKNSFGHLGFTGTSLWIEPATERIFILLTNRTHRPLPFVNINSTRRRFHELAVAELRRL